MARFDWHPYGSGLESQGITDPLGWWDQMVGTVNSGRPINQPAADITPTMLQGNIQALAGAGPLGLGMAQAWDAQNQGNTGQDVAALQQAQTQYDTAKYNLDAIQELYPGRDLSTLSDAEKSNAIDYIFRERERQNQLAKSGLDLGFIDLNPAMLVGGALGAMALPGLIGAGNAVTGAGGAAAGPAATGGGLAPFGAADLAAAGGPLGSGFGSLGSLGTGIGSVGSLGLPAGAAAGLYTPAALAGAGLSGFTVNPFGVTDLANSNGPLGSGIGSNASLGSGIGSNASLGLPANAAESLYTPGIFGGTLPPGGSSLTDLLNNAGESALNNVAENALQTLLGGDTAQSAPMGAGATNVPGAPRNPFTPLTAPLPPTRWSYVIPGY